MEIELAECTKCKARNAPQRTDCRCCGAGLPASGQQEPLGGKIRRRAKGYPTLWDMLEEMMRFFGPNAFSTIFGFKGLLSWALILSFVIYFQGWFAAALVLAILFQVYCFITLGELVFTILKVASGEIAEIRYDLLKIQEGIDQLMEQSGGTGPAE